MDEIDKKGTAKQKRQKSIGSTKSTNYLHLKSHIQTDAIHSQTFAKKNPTRKKIVSLDRKGNQSQVTSFQEVGSVLRFT